jgi:hypothetical protein
MERWERRERWRYGENEDEIYLMAYGMVMLASKGREQCRRVAGDVVDGWRGCGHA